MTCSVEGCGRSVKCVGYCGMHYQRVRTTGAAGPAGPIDRSGSGNSKWRGGRIRTGQGNRYWARYVPDHPAASRQGYVLEHRLVMEDVLGRLLTAEEVVHHLNHDPADNRPENLAVMPRRDHARHHAIDRGRTPLGQFPKGHAA